MREVLRQLGYLGESRRVAKTRGGKDVFEIEGVLYLEDTCYDPWPGMSYWGGQTIEEVNKRYAKDNERRRTFTDRKGSGSSLLDFGCGTGGFLLEYLHNGGGPRCGVEPHPVRESLGEFGLDVRAEIASFPQKFDTVTMFHVLEHLDEPIRVLREVRARMNRGGALVVEVPHARDSLLELTDYNPQLLHNEHMILHTRRSLTSMLSVAGFTVLEVEPVQRYGLGNHLTWLSKGRPEKKTEAAQARDWDLDSEYRKDLCQRGRSDTLIVVARAGF